MPELSVIILTFNSIKFIKPCLDSVFVQDYKDLEVIVVDNGSGDGTVGFIRRNYPQAILVESKKNLGAAKGRNSGIAIARGKWIFTQDCDVVLEKNFFSQAMDLPGRLSSDIGMIQPKILRMDKKIIYSCGIYLSRALKRFYDIGKGRVDRGQLNASKYLFGACSAAAFYRKQMLEEIKEDTGYFDERFFFLLEDADLSWRAQKKGYQALYFPKIICYHHGNSSLFNRRFRQYLCWRNRRLLLAKRKLNRYSLFIIFLIYDFPRFIFLILTNRYVRAFKSNDRIQ
jgi:hypothetical protein